MDVYNYHSVTREFLGSSKADPDPMNDGEFLFPAFCCDVEPPPAEIGYAQVWEHPTWIKVPDHRGEFWWNSDGQRVEITELGNPSDMGLSENAPELPENPYPSVPTPKLVAVGLLQVVDGEVFTVGVAAGIAFGLWMGPGLIWVFFSQEMPDLSYSYSYTVTPSSGQATVTDRQLSYMEITVTDINGSPVDPSEISIQVYRATI